MLVCPSCAHSNADSSRNCSACGTLLVPGKSGGKKPRVSLRVVRADGGQEASTVMTDGTVTCGQEGNLALPDDPFLAPTQVRFFFVADKLHAEDVGGGNGTFVRVKGETTLQSGSEVRIGRQRLKLERLPAAQPGPEGTVAWGSPVGNALFRLIQVMEGGETGARALHPRSRQRRHRLSSGWLYLRTSRHLRREGPSACGAEGPQELQWHVCAIGSTCRGEQRRSISGGQRVDPRGHRSLKEA